MHDLFWTPNLCTVEVSLAHHCRATEVMYNPQKHMHAYTLTLATTASWHCCEMHKWTLRKWHKISGWLYTPTLVMPILASFTVLIGPEKALADITLHQKNACKEHLKSIKWSLPTHLGSCWPPSCSMIQSTNCSSKPFTSWPFLWNTVSFCQKNKFSPLQEIQTLERQRRFLPKVLK